MCGCYCAWCWPAPVGTGHVVEFCARVCHQLSWQSKRRSVVWVPCDSADGSHMDVTRTKGNLMTPCLPWRWLALANKRLRQPPRLLSFSFFQGCTACWTTWHRELVDHMHHTYSCIRTWHENCRVTSIGSRAMTPDHVCSRQQQHCFGSAVGPQALRDIPPERVAQASAAAPTCVATPST